MRAFAGTEGATHPFWSPDGRNVGFFGDGKLKRISIPEGVVQTICDAPDGRGGSWSESGLIVFAPVPFGGLSKVPAAGGRPTPLTRQDQPGKTDRLPWFLPGGRRLLFLSGDDRETDICGLDLESEKVTHIAKERSEGRYAEPGYLLFVRDETLMAQAFDASSFKASGEPIPVAEQVDFTPLRSAGNFSVSQSRRLVYESSRDARKRQLTWFDLDGKELGRVGEPASILNLSLSPDGKRAAAGASYQSGEVRVYDLDRGAVAPFASGLGPGVHTAVWSSDGSEIALGASTGVRIKPSNGALDAKEVWTEYAQPMSWSPDGKQIVLRVQDRKTGRLGLSLLSLEGKPSARSLVATPAMVFSAELSADGKWLLYLSNESGRREVYVVPFPALGEKSQVSTDGAQWAAWAGTGRIVYWRVDGRLFAVDLDVRGGALQVGAPRPLWSGRPTPSGPVVVTRDGKRFLVAVPVDEMASRQLLLDSDWLAELKK
jgi:eukaryotic-like serine/threonine-protein kinase